MRSIKLLFLFVLPFGLLSQQLSFALEQIGGHALIEKGLSGKGVKIGIIDGGFLYANEDSSLSGHFSEGRVKYYKDFVTPDLTPYGGSKGQDDGHGTEVWEQIGGYNPEKKIQFGLATEAEYYLARTDQQVYERREEEEFLIEALAEMIDQGVRIVNISLGYTNGYSRRSENYRPEQIDGRSTWITSAMDSLLAQRDVLVIISAGNDGDTRWQTLSAPADSENVLSVGASKLNLNEEMKYSSKGPATLDYVKPEISCFSTTGTSFSAPVITGLAACLLELDSTLTSNEIKNLIIRSGSLYPYPNNYLGYGIPSGYKLLQLMSGKENEDKEVANTQKSRIAFKIKSETDEKIRSLAYHKVNGWRVIKKEIIRSKSRVVVKRPEGADQTTLLLKGTEPIEIFWKD